MRILIPADDDKKSVCIVFGRAPYFAVKDTQKNTTEFFTNNAKDAQGGAGIKAAQQVVDLNADVIITVRLGENSAEIMKDAQIKIYKSIGGTIEENFTAFEENKLNELDHFHAGYHGIR